MRKTIYEEQGSSEEQGLFDLGNFRSYMYNHEEVHVVYSHYINGIKNAVVIYHIESEDLTLKYTQKKEIAEKELVSVELFGKREKAIGEVEKRILKAAERFKKPSVEVPA
jgi:hypothetical protein